MTTLRWGIAHRYPGVATEPVEVIAFRLPESVDRREVKAKRIRQLHSLGKLATQYVGDQPDGAAASDPLRNTVGALVSHRFRVAN
jgi:hypothetical protein